MAKQWLTSTITHDLPGGHVDRFVHSPETAQQYEGVLRRLREAGREFTHGPGWIEYAGDHCAMGDAWTSRTRMEWTDAQPASD